MHVNVRGAQICVLESDSDFFFLVVGFFKKKRIVTHTPRPGLLGIHWRTREIQPQLTALAELPWNPTLTSHDVYVDIAMSDFGLPLELAEDVAAIFDSIDSYLASGAVSC